MKRERTLRLTSVIAFVASFVVCAATVRAQEMQQVEVGALTCTVEGGVGFIFGSSKDVSCVFDAYGRDANDYYTGEITKFGLDLGVTGKAVIVWAVLAQSIELPIGALAGNYGGVVAGASAGLGVGAKVLVGGPNQSITLQPLSVESRTGVNVAIAVAQLELRPNPQYAGLRSWSRPQLCGVSVTVAAGDTIGDAAGRCGTTVDALLKANPKIKNVRDVHSGTVLNVPRYSTEQSDTRCGARAVAVEGESLFHVARRCGTTIGALIDSNPEIQTLDALPPGTVVKLPPYATPATRRKCGFTVILGSPGSGRGSLDAIAEQCGVTVDALLENNPNIKNVRDIPTGTKFALPIYPRAQPARGCGSHAVVKDSESLAAIAKRCGTTVGALIDENPTLRNFNDLPAGRVVDIPPFAIPQPSS